MRTIPVSDEVFAALENSGKSAEDVLRATFHIKSSGLITPEGVVFPEKTAFLAWYKERAYWGVIRNGAIEIMEKSYVSVSAAASSITGRPTNGWDFWNCKLPGKSDFIRISKLRNTEH